MKLLNVYEGRGAVEAIRSAVEKILLTIHPGALIMVKLFGV